MNEFNFKIEGSFAGSLLELAKVRIGIPVRSTNVSSTVVEGTRTVYITHLRIVPEIRQKSE